MSAVGLRKMVVAIALVGILAGYVQADKMQLQEKLSKDISIKLNNVTIVDALEQIGQKAELKIVLSDEAIWKLPYGEATRLSVILSGPLADSMTEMLNAFFMRYAVSQDEITIYPRPELEHILGRPSAEQLELLKSLYTKTIKVYYFDEVQKTINVAIGQEILISPIEVQTQLNYFLLQLVGKEDLYSGVEVIGGRAIPISRTRKQKIEPNEPKEYNLPTPVTLVQLLNQVVIGRGSSDTKWYISGIDFPGQTPEVHVVSSSTFASLRLNQKIDVSYKDETLGKIFQDLASRAGVDLSVMPGSDLYANKLSANMQNVGIKQAILNIADMAGVVYEISEGDRSYIRLSGPGSVRTGRKDESKGGEKAASEGYVGKISIPMDGGKYFIEFMLRESDLTEELKKLRTEKMKGILEQLSRKSGND